MYANDNVISPAGIKSDITGAASGWTPLEALTNVLRQMQGPYAPRVKGIVIALEYEDGDYGCVDAAPDLKSAVCLLQYVLHRVCVKGFD